MYRNLYDAVLITATVVNGLMGPINTYIALNINVYITRFLSPVLVFRCELCAL